MALKGASLGDLTLGSRGDWVLEVLEQPNPVLILSSLGLQMSVRLLCCSTFVNVRNAHPCTRLECVFSFD